MDDDIIGSLGIQIEADASGLQGQYDTAVAQAQDAGDRIAQAFNAVAGIGAALAITEGLKDFSEQAIVAFGDIEKTTISIEHMTGSMEQTRDILQQVKAIGLSSPFSFPELQDTAQKMIAMGVPVEKIGESLRAISDAAAATGKSLLVAGGAFDRITETGSAAARQLAQLGVTTERLADVMHVTRDSVLDAFKNLPDQAARIEVLDQAMQRFAGSAAAQADGIRGAWQILENRFELVLQGMGSAMEPLLKQFIAFGTAIAEFAQQAIDDFNKLPGPVKETAVALGLMTAAIAPLAAAIGIFGQGVIGARAAVGLFGDALKYLGLSGAEAAAGETLATAATVAQGTAAVAATVEAGSLAVAETAVGEASSIAAIQMGLFGESIAADTVIMGEGVTQMTLFGETASGAAIAVGASGEAAAGAGIGIAALGVAATAAAAAIAVFVGYEIGKWAQDNVPGLESLERSIMNIVDKLPFFGLVFDDLRAKVQSFGGETKDQKVEIQNLQDQLSSAGVTLNQFGDDAEHFIQVLRDTRQAIADTTKEADGYGLALDTLLRKHKDLGVELTTANGILALAEERFQKGAISAAQLGEAFKNLHDVQQKLNALNPVYAETLGGITEAYNKQQNALRTLEQAHAQLLSIENRTADQENILIEVETKLAAAYHAHHDAVANLPKAYDGLVTSADQFAKKERDVTDAVGYAKSVFEQAAKTSDGSAEAQRTVTDALNQYIDKLKASGALMTDTITINVRGVDVVTTLGNAIKMLKDGQGDWNTVTQNGVQLLRDHALAATNATPAIKGLAGATNDLGTDTSKALNYFSPLANGINEVASASNQALNYTDPLAASERNLGAAADGSVGYQSALANAISKVGDAASTTKGHLDSAKGSTKAAGDQFAQTAGDAEAGAHGLDVMTQSADALSTALAFLADVSSGLTVLAGSGSAHDTINSHFVSTFDQISQLEQQQAQAKTGGAALQQQLQAQIDSWFAAQQKQITAITANTTATNAAAIATDGLTQSTGNLKINSDGTMTVVGGLGTAVANLGTAASTASQSVSLYNGLLNNSSTTTTDALGNVTTAYTSTAQAANQFIDGLGNVYNSYNALVDAIKNNPLLGGPATSSTTTLGSGPSSFVPTTPGPQNSGGGGQSIIPNVLGTFNGQVITGSPGMSLADALKLFDAGVGSGSGGRIISALTQPVNTSPISLAGIPNVSSNQQGPTGIVINMNYPQVTNQTQASSLMQQAVSLLRNVPQLKL